VKHRSKRTHKPTERRRLYKSTKHSIVSGVCYGIAQHFKVNTLTVRALTVVLLFVNPLVTVAIYFLLAWMLPDQPEHEAIGGEEAERGSALTAASSAASDYTAPLRTRHREVVQRFEALNRRLADMERTVTSREFQMDRELKKAERPGDA